MTTAIKPEKFIAYYRVSTRMQGKSGLGLDAQRACVEKYVQDKGGTVIRSYQEIESGTKSDRPELAKALSDAKRSNAVLVVGKLDRLARDAHLITGLLKTGVRFVACDFPNADRTMLGFMAVIGEHEQRLISTRTRDAIDQAKAKGRRYGKPENFHDQGRKLGAVKAGQNHRKRASEAYTDLVPWLQEMRSQGQSLQAIADRLNQEGHTTRMGKEWNRIQVGRVLDRFDERAAG